jgi:uncharacterized protein YqjF (DUF2071 family)
MVLVQCKKCWVVSKELPLRDQIWTLITRCSLLRIAIELLSLMWLATSLLLKTLYITKIDNINPCPKTKMLLTNLKWCSWTLKGKLVHQLPIDKDPSVIRTASLERLNLQIMLFNSINNRKQHTWVIVGPNQTKRF